jgi:hypothetical protein
MVKWGLVVSILLAMLTACPWDVSVSNTVPDFMPYVTAELDVSGAMPGSIRDLTFEAVPSGADDIPIFVLVMRPDSAGADVVVMVDGSLGSIRVEQESTAITRFDTRPFRRLNGLVQVGNLVYNADLRKLVNAARPDGDFRPIIVTDIDDEYYVVDLADPQSLLLEGYDLEFLPTGDFVEALTTFDSDMTFSASAVDARMYDGGVADFVVTTTAGEVWFFSARLSVGPEGEAVRIPSSLRFRSIRRTAAGLIGIRDRDELVRVNRTTGAIEDTFRPSGGVNITRDMPVVFDPAGKYYLLFDSSRGVIYRVAPWW